VTERPLSIAVDANVLAGSWGGIPKYVDRIVRGLVAGGDRVHLLVNDFGWRSGVPGAHDVGLRFKGEAGWRNVALPAWAALHRVDVVWAPNTALPRWSPAPTVSTIHDLAPLLFPDSKPPSVLESFQTMLPRSVRAAERVICVSQSTAADARRLWDVPADRIDVIPCGVDARFHPGDRAAAIADVRARHGLDRPFVLHVGTLEPRKGLDVLIAAAAQAGDAWHLVLAGRLGFDGERLAAAARAAGATLLQGLEDDDLVDLYRAAEAFAAPAIHEGFGIGPLEAMACATPVIIAADAGALTEVSGAAAVTVAERTPAAWLAGIAEARARREELTVRGSAVAARYDWADSARATRAVLAAAAAA
jgi:glycosyltransferase involved in cell wall biosynthesis